MGVGGPWEHFVPGDVFAEHIERRNSLGRLLQDVEGGRLQHPAHQAAVRYHWHCCGTDAQVEVLENQESFVGTATRLNRGTGTKH